MVNIVETPVAPYGVQFITNGYLVAAPWAPNAAGSYLGIDDDLWPIELESNWRKFARSLGMPDALAGVQVATEWEETLVYWELCRDSGIQARLILIETRYTIPQVDPPVKDWEWIGYDVADPLGEHSTVRHELVVGTAPQLMHWRDRLNRNGLFDRLNDAEEYILERQALISEGDHAGMVDDSVPSNGGDFGWVFVPVHVALFRKIEE